LLMSVTKRREQGAVSFSESRGSGNSEIWLILVIIDPIWPKLSILGFYLENCQIQG